MSGMVSREQLMDELQRAQENKGGENPPIEDTILSTDTEESRGAKLIGLPVSTDLEFIKDLKLKCINLVDFLDENVSSRQEGSSAINHVKSCYLHARLAHADILIEERITNV